MHNKFPIRFGFSWSNNRKSKIQNLKWAGIFAIGVAFVMCGAVAEAQQADKVPRIGILAPGSASGAWPGKAFWEGLRERGYIEGRNIAVEYRYAEGRDEVLPALAAELIRLMVDVIVTTGTPGTRAAKSATRSVPIIMSGVGDAVRAGLVASLARPGGNVTGTSSFSPELRGKQLEVLKETVPRLSRVAVTTNPDNPVSAFGFSEAQAAAQALGLEIHAVEYRNPDDFERIFDSAVRGRAGALSIGPDPLMRSYRTRIVQLAARSRLPVMYPQREFVEAGGLMAYGTSAGWVSRRAAYYVDKILKGVKPADLPVEQPMKFELVINLKTAKQIGLTIPPNVLARADKVIR